MSFLIHESSRQTYKSKNLSTDIDKHTDSRGQLFVTIDSKRSQDGGEHLVAKASNRSTNTGRDIPCLVRSLQLKPPCQKPGNDGAITDISNPQPISRAGMASSTVEILQPPVRHGSTELFTQYTADDDGNVLQANLLCVKVELLSKCRGHLNNNGNVSVAKTDGVSAGSNENPGKSSHEKRFDEVDGLEGTGVNPAWDQVSDDDIPCILGGCGGGLSLFLGNVYSLITNDEVGKQLDKVDNGEDPEDPLHPQVLGHESHDKRSGRGANGGHQCPPAEFLCSLFRFAKFCDDATADTDGRRDEDCSNDSSCHLASVRSAEDAPDIAHHAAKDGQQTDMVAAVGRAERSPEERKDSQKEDL